MSKQNQRQASVRGATGTAYNIADDWKALFAIAGVTTGGYNDRLLAWINIKLGTSYRNVNDAKRAYAIAKGVTSWNELGTFTP